MQEVLYVGKRSRILKNCIQYLIAGDIISLNKAIELHKKKKLTKSIIVIFSLPERKSQINNYFQFLSEVKCKKIIYISSTCIFARDYYGNSYIPYYLNLKYNAHKIIISRKNSISIIVGILDKNFPISSYPYSSYQKIISSINSAINNYSRNIKEVYAFEICCGNPNILEKIIVNIRNLFNGKIKYFGILLDLIFKFLNIKLRGYTFLSSQKFSKVIRIGDGSFGSVFGSTNELIFRSNSRNITSSKIFLLTMHGHSKIGLDSIRHGVEIIKSKNKIFKKWRFSLRIRNPFKRKINQNVEEIRWMNDSNIFRVISNKKVFFCSKLILAAGTLENTRLSLNLCSEVIPENEITLSDHFISKFGEISKEELLKHNYLKKIFFDLIIKRDSLMPLENLADYGFIEFRILCDKNKNIFIFIFNFLESYLFNRLGICFNRHNKYSVVSQLLIEDVIGIKVKNNKIKLFDRFDVKFHRNYLIKKALQECTNKFSSFKKNKIVIEPSHHLWGGKRILQDRNLGLLIKKKKLIIAGSPSNDELGPYHHTLRVIRKLKKLKIKNLFINR